MRLPPTFSGSSSKLLIPGQTRTHTKASEVARSPPREVPCPTDGGAGGSVTSVLHPHFLFLPGPRLGPTRWLVVTAPGLFGAGTAPQTPRLSLSWEVSAVFLVTEVTGQRDRRGEGPFSIQPIRGAAVNVTSRPVAGLGCTPSCSRESRPHLPRCPPWRDVTVHSRTWGWGSRSTSGGGGAYVTGLGSPPKGCSVSPFTVQGLLCVGLDSGAFMLPFG